MKLIVNGDQIDFDNISSVDDLANSLKIGKEGSAIELNGEITKQRDWSSLRLKDGDRLEMITFVGGG